MNEHTNEWMNKWTNKPMKDGMNKRSNEWMNGQTHKQTNNQSNNGKESIRMKGCPIIPWFHRFSDLKKKEQKKEAEDERQKISSLFQTSSFTKKI